VRARVPRLSVFGVLFFFLNILFESAIKNSNGAFKRHRYSLYLDNRRHGEL